MKNYELLTVFKPNLDSEEIDKLVDKLNETISGLGGKIDSQDKMNRKKLAYEIQNFRDGFFVVTNLSMPANKISELKKLLTINDAVLRTMFLEVTKKMQVVAG